MVKHLNFRPYETSDSSEIVELIKKNLLEINSKDYDTEVIKKLYKYFTPNRILQMSYKRELYVAVIDNKIVGTISLEKDTIFNVFVLIEYHRKGIGRILVNHIEEIAKKKEVQKIKITTSKTGYKFFKALGYRRLRMVQTQNFGENIQMEKSLN
ncbi:MAG: GNAT family N-acetyltransferase [Spirochaetes bacterium]|nr:GNAT family N-acetyltransferase [Spirochaetota bacterium]